MKILNATPKEIVWNIWQDDGGVAAILAKGQIGNMKFSITRPNRYLVLSITIHNTENVYDLTNENEFFRQVFEVGKYSVVDVMKVAQEKFNELWFQLSECAFVKVTKEMQEEAV